jgi:hypothetical protein
MERTDAERLVAILRSAFPTPFWDRATVALYVAEVEQLDDFDLAHAAVRQLTRERSFRPPIADVFDTYRRLRKRRDDARAHSHGLPVAPLTPEQLEENKTRVAELMDHVWGGKGRAA